MKTKFRTIGLYSNSSNKKVLSIGQQVEEVLLSKGCKILYNKAFNNAYKPKQIKASSANLLASKADLIIAIGGDGTMLSCSREFGSKNVPILGINLGRLGFLTDIAPDELTTKLSEVVTGRFDADERFFLTTKIKGQRSRFTALNEVVIHSGAIAQLIEYDLYIDDVFVYRQKADGLIIASPTGSTAYSLSGGGPIMHPSLDAIALLPMFPHSLNNSPLVVKAESSIKVILTDKNTKAQLSFDSHNSIRLKGNKEINICKSKSVLKLIHPVGHDFYDACRNKLGWSKGIVRPM